MGAVALLCVRFRTTPILFIAAAVVDSMPRSGIET